MMPKVLCRLLRAQWLAIKETDDEKTKARKKKLLKSMKSKIRFQQKDLAQKQKQDSWQSFLKGKGSKKKTGFLTGERAPRNRGALFVATLGSPVQLASVASGACWCPAGASKSCLRAAWPCAPGFMRVLPAHCSCTNNNMLGPEETALL